MRKLQSNFHSHLNSLVYVCIVYERYKTQTACNAYFGTKIMLQEKIKDVDEDGGGN